LIEHLFRSLAQDAPSTGDSHWDSDRDADPQADPDPAAVHRQRTELAAEIEARTAERDRLDADLARPPPSAASGWLAWLAAPPTAARLLRAAAPQVGRDLGARRWARLAWLGVRVRAGPG